MTMNSEYSRYKMSKIMINRELLEGVIEIDLPIDSNLLYHSYDRYERFLIIKCLNKNPSFESFKSYFDNENEIMFISDKISKLYISSLINMSIKFEGIFELELEFLVFEEHNGSKCPYCSQYEMELENINKDGLVYNVCRKCNKTWYEWDELNNVEVEGK